jgi:hypothetical protein
VSSAPLVAGESTVRLRGPHGLLDVTVRAEKIAADGLTCANPRPNGFLAYRPVTITPVESDPVESGRAGID